METEEMTSAEQFGTWLAQAMRRAGYDIDSQRGGGRIALAEKMKISKSTVTRWLSGEVLPAAEYFEPLAAALNVKVTELLIGAGVLSASDVAASSREIRESDVLTIDATNLTPEQMIAALGVTNPDAQAAVLHMIELLRNTEVHHSPKRDHRQRGVGGHPRPHEVKADEPGE